MEITKDFEWKREEHRGRAPKPGNGGKREGAGRKPAGRDTRTRNWLTVVYPESVKPEWREIISGWHVPAIVSPLHDKDVRRDGKLTPKPPHYHVMLMFKGKKSYSQLCEMVGSLVARGHAEPVPCYDMRGSARYFCHLDDPDKAQYAPADVVAYGGADYFGLIDLPTDRERYIREMCQWCRAEGCISYAELMDYAAANRPEWFSCLVRTSTMVMFRYLRSIEDEFKKGKYRKEVPPAVEDVETPDGNGKVVVATGALQETASPLEEAQREAARLRQRLAEVEYAVRTLEGGGAATV